MRASHDSGSKGSMKGRERERERKERKGKEGKGKERHHHSLTPFRAGHSSSSSSSSSSSITVNDREERAYPVTLSFELIQLSDIPYHTTYSSYTHTLIHVSPLHSTPHTRS